MSLRPIRGVRIVASTDYQELSAQQIAKLNIGEKAFGLACLPQSWTLPFFCVDSNLLDTYRRSKSKKTTILAPWLLQIRKAAAATGLTATSPIVIRSSAVSESMEDRGRLYSIDGTMDRLEVALVNCLDKLVNDADLKKKTVHLIVQQRLLPLSGKGHLSNERRCYEEARDWLGEFEEPESDNRNVFSVNLRNWRRGVRSSTEPGILACNIRPNVSKVLREVASWGYSQGLRLHFEWVWDGRRLYIVQVDEAGLASGVDPTTPSLISVASGTFNPKCLKPIGAHHAKIYNKIKNVYSYIKLELPITNLFVLDDEKVLKQITKGQPPKSLLDDLKALSRNSLVIRTDLATDDQQKRQLLPRTNEVRKVEEAVKFLEKTYSQLVKEGVTEKIAFIFHNFIPAVSSAFAYAAPSQRKVRIEALWGLPEGLYYNSHDKIEVDTQNPGVKNLEAQKSKFVITKRPRFKQFFVSPDKDGKWITKTILEPWDWRPSIQKDDWIRRIAIDSRRIAELENRPVSIMWFIDVPKAISESPVFPWYHEEFDPSQIRRASSARRKTPFDKSVVVSTRDDMENLRNQAKSGARIRQIRIQPLEDALLRNKNLLSEISQLANSLGAVILIEGGTLSHAYYQLMKSGAIVEVAHSFDEHEETQEFNKLVRDAIPEKIAKGGEQVEVGRLTGDQLLRALKEKLVEESIEVLDAGDHESILEEIADVDEVISSILKQLHASRRDLEAKRKGKFSKAGGFDEGYVLMNTNNPSPMKRESKNPNLELDLEIEDQKQAAIKETTVLGSNPVLSRWADRRDHGSANEQIMNIVVAMVRDAWTADSAEISIGVSDAEVLKARIKGRRKGANLEIELSIFLPPTQLKLLK